MNQAPVKNLLAQVHLACDHADRNPNSVGFALDAIADTAALLLGTPGPAGTPVRLAARALVEPLRAAREASREQDREALAGHLWDVVTASNRVLDAWITAYPTFPMRGPAPIVLPARPLPARCPPPAPCPTARILPFRRRAAAGRAPA